MPASGYAKLSEDKDSENPDVLAHASQRKKSGRKRRGYARLDNAVEDGLQDPKQHFSSLERPGVQEQPPDAETCVADVETSTTAHRERPRRRPPMLTMEDGDADDIPQTMSPQQAATRQFKRQLAGIEQIHAYEFAQRSPVSIYAEGLKQQLPNMVHAKATDCADAIAVGSVPGSPAAAQELRAAKARLDNAAAAAAATLATKLTAGSPLATKLANGAGSGTPTGRAWLMSPSSCSSQAGSPLRAAASVLKANMSSRSADVLEGLSPKAIVIGCSSEVDRPHDDCVL